MIQKPIEKVYGLPLRKYRGIIGFFNKDGKWEELPLDEYMNTYWNEDNMRRWGLSYWLFERNRTRPWDLDLYRSKEDLFYNLEFEKLNGNSIIAALTRMKPGETYSDFFKSYKEWEEYFARRPKPFENEMDINRFVVKIFKPIFIRLPDNPRKKSFDIIKVGVDTCTEWPTDPKQFLKANIREVINMVLEKIKKNQSFKSYGVPIGCLALTNIVKCGNAYYEFIFELKKELRSEENYGNESK